MQIVSVVHVLYEYAFSKYNTPKLTSAAQVYVHIPPFCCEHSFEALPISWPVKPAGCVSIYACMRVHICVCSRLGTVADDGIGALPLLDGDRPRILLRGS
jgi:hypothetical protein